MIDLARVFGDIATNTESCAFLLLARPVRSSFGCMGSIQVVYGPLLLTAEDIIDHSRAFIERPESLDQIELTGSKVFALLMGGHHEGSEKIFCELINSDNHRPDTAGT
jgi:hypothetical protein